MGTEVKRKVSNMCSDNAELLQMSKLGREDKKVGSRMNLLISSPMIPVS